MALLLKNSNPTTLSVFSRKTLGTTVLDNHVFSSPNCLQPSLESVRSCPIAHPTRLI